MYVTVDCVRNGKHEDDKTGSRIESILEGKNRSKNDDGHINEDKYCSIETVEQFSTTLVSLTEDEESLVGINFTRKVKVYRTRPYGS